MKRKQLATVHEAVKAATGEQTSTIVTTAINLPRPTWELLRRVAFARAVHGGGRASVSRVLSDLVEAHRAELERELR